MGIWVDSMSLLHHSISKGLCLWKSTRKSVWELIVVFIWGHRLMGSSTSIPGGSVAQRHQHYPYWLKKYSNCQAGVSPPDKIGKVRHVFLFLQWEKDTSLKSDKIVWVKSASPHLWQTCHFRAKSFLHQGKAWGKTPDKSLALWLFLGTKSPHTAGLPGCPAPVWKAWWSLVPKRSHRANGLSYQDGTHWGNSQPSKSSKITKCFVNCKSNADSLSENFKKTICFKKEILEKCWFILFSLWRMMKLKQCQSHCLHR